MKNYFVLTTDREVADAIKVFSERISLNQNRTFTVGAIHHDDGFSTVQIIAKPEDGNISPKDLFWLGWFSGTTCNRKKL